MDTKLLFLAVAAALPITGGLAACATDNGNNVYGDQYAPPRGSDGGDGGAEDGGATDGAGDDARADGDATVACSAGTVAVLAGTDSSLTYAISEKGGPWSGAAVSGGSTLGVPALVPFGAGFLGLFRGAGDTLSATSQSGGAFGAASTVVAAGVKDAPALAASGASAHAIYATPGAIANDYVHRTFNGTAWSADDPVKPSGGAQSFGNTAPAIAAVGAELVLAQNGTNEGLYVQRFDGAWSTAKAIVGAGTFQNGVPPVLAPASGAFDLVLLYADNTNVHNIGFATHQPGKPLDEWSNATTIALAQTASPFSAALVKSNVVAVAFRGNDAKLYVTFGTIGASAIAWTAPAAILPGGGTTDGPPAIAKGVCGDDAIVVYGSAGQTKATRLRGTTWAAPEAVTGAAGARVAVATR
jgi:hypothetical protein